MHNDTFQTSAEYCFVLERRRHHLFVSLTCLSVIQTSQNWQDLIDYSQLQPNRIRGLKLEEQICILPVPEHKAVNLESCENCSTDEGCYRKVR